MGDRIINLGSEGHTLTLRTIDYGLPSMRCKVIYLGEGAESGDLTTAQIGMLAHAFASAYFNMTQRVVWPVEGAMLHAYEKQQMDAEAAHLKWLKESPAPENNALAAAYEAKVGGAVDPMREMFSSILKQIGDGQ